MRASGILTITAGFGGAVVIEVSENGNGKVVKVLKVEGVNLLSRVSGPGSKAIRGSEVRARCLRGGGLNELPGAALRRGTFPSIASRFLYSL
jgi:hypothetical protein